MFDDLAGGLGVEGVRQAHSAPFAFLAVIIAGEPASRIAIVLRCWTMAARWNPSRAPESPRNRIRPKRWWVFSVQISFPLC